MLRSKTFVNAVRIVLLAAVAGLLMQAARQTSTAGRWSPAYGPMLATRDEACSVLLPDGRVLIAGGKDTSGATLASAEFYNPRGPAQAGAWMAQPRSGHACALLPDGTVLAAGGRDALGAVTGSSEIYDPAVNAWRTGPSMSAPRAGATVSVLRDSRVLLAGGVSDSGASASLEIYDPKTVRFTTAPSLMSSPRQQHAAAVMGDGRVLLAGGTDGQNVLNTADIFDPKSGAVTAADPMSVPRVDLSAASLLDGRVVVLGGSDGKNDLATAELFDGKTGAWTVDTDTMATPRRGAAAVRIPDNNTVLIAGGTTAGQALASAEVYVPWQHAFLSTGTMASHRTGPKATAMPRGAVMLAGGSATNEILSGPTITTDRADYHPGATVTFTFSGWLPAVPIKVTMTESPDSFGESPITFPPLIPDSTGTATYTGFAPDNNDVGVAFFVTGTQTFGPDANGNTTVLTAQAGFTDGAPYKIGVVASPAGASGGSFNVTYVNSGSKIKDRTLTTPFATLATDGGTEFSINAIAPTVNGYAFTGAISASYSTTGSANLADGTISGTTGDSGDSMIITLIYSGKTAPSFSGLSSPSIVYGTASTTLSGTVTGTGTNPPTGNVSVTLNGSTQSATLIPGAGNTSSFSAMFPTGSLTVAGSTYAITYHYDGDVNYNAISPDANANLTVTPAPLTITAKDQTKNYGTALSFAGTEFTTIGLLNADTVSGVTLNSAGAANSATVAGTPYSIVPGAAVGTGLGNYTVTYANGSLIVKAAPLTITAKEQSKTYGTAFTFSGTEFTTAGPMYNSDAVTSVTLTSAGAAAAATVADTGYSIVPSAAVGTGLGNYTIAYANGKLTVNPALLTITAKDQSKTYGAAFTFAGTEFTTTGTLYNSDTVTSVTLTSAGAAAAATVADTAYSIVPGAAVGTGLGNYTITYANGKLTVNPAPLTVTAKDQSKTYGAILTLAGTEFTTAGTMYNGDAVTSVTLASAGSAATATVNGSPYGIAPSTAAGAGVSNYQITYVDGKLTVNPAPLTITAKDQSRTYGAAFTFTGTEFATTGTMYNGDTVTSVTFASAGAAGSATVAGGPYSIVPSTAAGTGLGNYTITYANGSMKVTPAPLTITAKDQNKAYGAAFAFTGNEFTAATLYNSDAVTGVTLTSAGAAATATVAGSPYGIAPSAAVGTGLDNYTIMYAGGSLKVSPAPLTITAKDQSKTYGATFTFTGSEFTTAGTLYNGDMVSAVTLTSAGAAANAGVTGALYSIVPSVAAGSGLGNYTIAYVEGKLTVNPALLTITAKDQSKTYGATFTFAGAEFTTASTLYNSDTVASVTFASAGAAATATVAGTPYSIVPSAAVGTGLGNYTITYANGSLQVNPAPLSITAKDQSKTYGAAFTFAGAEFTTTGTLYNGDTVTSVAFASAGTAANAAVSGSPYPLAPSAAAGSGTGNYTITYVSGTLTVSKGLLTVTPTAASRNYGAANPAFAFTISPEALADSHGAGLTGVSCSADAQSNSPAGSYPIHCSGGVDPNYSITYAPGSLAVNPAPLTITAGRATRPYGDPNPASGYSTLPAVLVDANHVGLTGLTCSSGANENTLLGDYSIGSNAYNCSGGADPNYNISYAPGTLSIAARSTIVQYTGTTSAYSFDCITASGVLTDVESGLPITGAPINLVISGMRPVGAFTNASGIVSAQMGCNLPEGRYTAEADYPGVEPYGYAAGSSATLNSSLYPHSGANNFTLSPRPVGPVAGSPIYTGVTYFWTAGSSSNTATVTLAATIQDDSTDCSGDISQARVTFGIVDGATFTPIPGAANLPVFPVSAGSSAGAANATVQWNLNNSDSQTVLIGIVVDGGGQPAKYYRSTPQDNTLVTVSKPAPYRLIDFGGSLHNAPTGSNAGSWGALQGVGGSAGNPVATVAQISGFVDYSRKDATLQGSVTVTINSRNLPSGLPDPSGAIHTYLFNSGSVVQLAFVPGMTGASFSAKGTVTDITQPDSPVAVDSGATVQIDLTTATTTETADGTVTIPATADVSVIDATGAGLLFSSQWTGTKTIQTTLYGTTALNGLGVVKIQ